MRLTRENVVSDVLLLKARKLHRNVALRSWLMWEYGIWDMDFKLDFVITSVRRSVVFLLSLLEEIMEGLSWYPGILEILELCKPSYGRRIF